MNVIDQAKQSYRRNVDNRIVASVVVGTAVFGGVMFLMNKSNVKALKEAAKVAKGGK